MILLSLLQCPFCANPEPTPVKTPDGHTITCPRCGSTGPKAKTVNDAQLLWNERPYRRAIDASRNAAFEDTAKLLFGLKI